MRKYNKIFLLLLLIKNYLCNYDTPNQCIEIITNNKEDCFEIVLDSDYACCYVSFKMDKEKFNYCVPLLNNEEGINSYSEMIKKAKDISIICSNKYIIYNIYLLIAIFIILF